MDVELWVLDLLEDIKKAAEKGENYDLHLESEYVKDIAKAYDATSCIEIY